MSNIVCIDYSHGIATKGKQSPDGRLLEGVWSRDVGRRITKALCEIGIEVFEVTPEDDDISLNKRCERVNEFIKKHPNDNIIFISVHSNAAPSDICDKDGWYDKGRGASVYVHTNASEDSVKLAHCYYDYVEEFNLKGNRNVPKERVWRANYAVLRGTHCPGMLTENLFMTSHEDVEFLLSEEGKQTIENLHIAAICKYFGIPISVCVA